MFQMFSDRTEAGAALAKKLLHYKGMADAVVLALPRGGVVTGYEIAKTLGVPLDVLIVRKVGFPGEPELAVGAVAETGKTVINNSIISAYGVPESYIREEVERQKEEIRRRVNLYRGGRATGPLLPNLAGKVVILVDDGVATGATIKAAIATLKEEQLKRLVVGLPVSPPETARELGRMADEFVCLLTPEGFTAVGAYYSDFRQTTDEEVVEMLKTAAEHTSR